MENSLQKPGLEQTILNLLQQQSKYGVDNINMLLMLSLVNLMGIVDILQRATGGGGLSLEISENSHPAPEQNASSSQSRTAPNDDLMNLVQQAASGRLNPDQLIASLGRSGQINPALLTMLTQMMPPPPPPPEPKQSSQKTAPKPNIEQHSKENSGPAAEVDSEDEWGKKGPAQKNILKWDPRLG